MTTLRIIIANYLRTKIDYIHSSDIHNYVCGAGYRRSSSERTLGKMLKEGEVISKETGRKTQYRINLNYKHSKNFDEKPVEVTEQSVLRKADLTTNGIFELNRQNSRIYTLDQMLREVRNASDVVRA